MQQFVKPSVPRRLRSRRGERPGFTLLELLMVLGLVVVMGALSWPRISTLLKQQKLQSTSEEVRRFLDHARVRAVEEGRTLEVRVEANGRRYIVLPHDPPDPMAGPDTPQQTQSLDGTPVRTGRVQEPFRVHQLPQDCNFYVPSGLTGEAPALERINERWLDQVINGMLARDATWTAPILYHADGSSTGGKVTVMDQNRRYVNLLVRDLTGAVTSNPPKVLTEMSSVAAP